MQGSKNQAIDARLSNPDQGNSLGTPQRSDGAVRSISVPRGPLNSLLNPVVPKSARFHKFEKWRIDSSLVEFLEGTREFQGGCATVSRATLASAVGVWGHLNTIKVRIKAFESRH